MTAPVSRRPRSDGERSRQAILATAARLASTHGIDRLSIGDLATEVGMSKSGLYAHFGSKEELQLADDRRRRGDLQSGRDRRCR
jgi:AcrR family transcriptional regulator